MKMPRPRPGHFVTIATIGAGMTIAAALLGAPRLALAIGLLASAAALTALRHLVNVEETRP